MFTSYLMIINYWVVVLGHEVSPAINVLVDFSAYIQCPYIMSNLLTSMYQLFKMSLKGLSVNCGEINLFTETAITPQFQTSHTHSLTSTENFFPKVKRKGCMSMSGSLWKQLGLAWCWECRRVHHLAEAPCSTEEQSMKSTFKARIPSVPDPNFPPGAPQSLQSTNFYRKTLTSFPGTHNQMAHHKLV